MAENSKIEWCDATFNPWIGCTKVSPGCDHCYAARQDAHRRWTPDGWGGPRSRTSQANWRKPLQWNKSPFHECTTCGKRGEPHEWSGCGPQQDGVCCSDPHVVDARRRVFCASLADVFDNEVPAQWRAELFALIAQTPNLDWLLLTKRIGNVARMLDAPGMQKCGLPTNIWLGATVVNQEEADRDIPKLLSVPARVRFLSVEPMLEPVYVEDIPDPTGGVCLKPLAGLRWVGDGQGRSEVRSLGGRIDWVICGGESGPKARPMHPDWARSLRDQCATAGVPFLFKQWGEWVPYEHSAQPPFLWSQHGHELDGHALPDFESDDGRKQREWHCDFADQILARRVGKKAAGRLLDGVQYNGFPK